jgi:hypothetical protein
MLYGDGDFNQAMLDHYYRHYYGYGVNSHEVRERLVSIADDIASKYPMSTRVVDFGGAGDDGKSILVQALKAQDMQKAYSINAGEPVPECDILLASHVLEHIYDMAEAMNKITKALAPDGLLIVDGPDATGMLLHWHMPIIDYHTKHVNHFRMLDYLRLMDRYGFELIDSVRYVDVRASQSAPCLRMHFRRVDMAVQSMAEIHQAIAPRVEKLQQITQPVNVWGLGDVTWHLLAQVKLNVLEYIDNDPAYRGATYDGKTVLERPTNDAPIVIMSQGQREKLIQNIRAMGVTNEIIEI